MTKNLFQADEHCIISRSGITKKGRRVDTAIRITGTQRSNGRKVFMVRATTTRGGGPDWQSRSEIYASDLNHGIFYYHAWL